MRIPLPEQGHSLITYLAFAKSYEKIIVMSPSRAGSARDLFDFSSELKID